MNKQIKKKHKQIFLKNFEENIENKVKNIWKLIIMKIIPFIFQTPILKVRLKNDINKPKQKEKILKNTKS